MKTLILLITVALLSIGSEAQPRLLTLSINGITKTNTFELREYESLKIVSMRDSLGDVAGFPYGHFLLDVKTGFSRLGQDAVAVAVGLQNKNPLILVGPATITLIDLADGRTAENLAFVTFELTPQSVPPDKTLIVLPGTNGANVTLECSTNLVDWSTATNGIYNNMPSAKFFRIKAERLLP